MAITQIKSISPTQLTNAGIGNPSGPLSSLDSTSDSFSYNLYKYPISTVNPLTPDLGHEIIFYINIPTNSYWNNVTQGSVSPVINRSSNATRYGLRTDGSDSGSSLLGGATASAQNLILNQKTTRTTAAVSLYIPNTMVWSQNMRYENVSMNQSVGPLTDTMALLNGIATGEGKVAIGALGSLVPDILKFFGQGGIGSTVANTKDNFLQALGLADNPQNYVMFRQIDFRHFRFDFVLTPENQNETQIINQIIYLFRFHSAPEVATGSVGRFFVPPSTFDIDIIHNGQRNNNLPRISTCALESVNVDFAGAGSWVTNYDGMPRQVRLGLSFVEMEILTKDRIQQSF